MKSLLISAACGLILTVVPHFSHATESVDCLTDIQTLRFLFNMDKSYAGFEFYQLIDRVDTSDWKTEKMDIDLHKKTIEFSAAGKTGKIRDLQLTVNKKESVLTLNGMQKKPAWCDWTVFQD